jgi:hypothetical protein
MRAPSEPGAVSLRALQALVSALLALTLIGTCALVDGLAGSAAMADWMDAQRRAEAQRGDAPDMHQGPFLEVGTRIFLEEIPRADYARGGVCFVGSSQLRPSLQVWNLTGELAELVHNLGLPAATHIDQTAVLRWLVDERGLLSAAPGKTEIVFGLFYGNAVAHGHGQLGYLFPEFVEGLGLFEYAQARLRSLDLSDLTKTLLGKKTRCSDLLHVLRDYLRWRDGGLVLLSPVRPVEPASAAQRQDVWRGLMGRDWRAAMARQLQSFAASIDVLQRRGASVRAVLMPLASWHREMEHAQRYAEEVARICDERGVELVDLSEMLADGELYDGTHPSYTGAIRVHEALLAIARRHLQRAGLLHE